jgi:hypothetical protein
VIEAQVKLGICEAGRDVGIGGKVEHRIEARFREVHVPTFTGAPRTIGKAFTI